MDSLGYVGLVVMLLLERGLWISGNQCECAMDVKERKNCGYSGISEKECQTKGCCFDSEYPGVPWCFHPRIKNAEGKCVKDVSFFSAGRWTFICINPSSARCGASSPSLKVNAATFRKTPVIS
uniref:P-type domain-containing protein n=1 Tax=Chrysemys picta bellii TaxID=8478 RepID=A0A8C3FLP0_CHRPI